MLYALGLGTICAVAGVGSYRKARPLNQPRTMQSVFDRPREEK